MTNPGRVLNLADLRRVEEKGLGRTHVQSLDRGAEVLQKKRRESETIVVLTKRHMNVEETLTTRRTTATGTTIELPNRGIELISKICFFEYLSFRLKFTYVALYSIDFVKYHFNEHNYSEE